MSSVFVIGSGGREHALAWKLAQSPEVAQVYVAPGNPGTEWLEGPAPSQNVDIPVGDTDALVEFARTHNVDLVVVGPEVPLADGVTDAFQAIDLPVFGPTQAAARLESSKAFAKGFMQEHGIPTAAYEVFDTIDEARAYVETVDHPVVVKASGLAAGKGVIMCDNNAGAVAALERIMQEGAFGSAGDTVVIEERLSGPEVSLLAFSDGHTVALMPTARDHKRAYEGGKGPNTGGMGAYAPVPDMSQKMLAYIEETILQPAVEGMAAQGTPYTGVLYAGLMMTAHGPKVLEFNARFGDPEAEAILPLLESDLYAILMACTTGTLADVDIEWRRGACASIALASPGYPGKYPKGIPISGVEEAAALEDVFVFQAGTTENKGQLFTYGGRVMHVAARGIELSDALKRAYQAIEHIQFEGMQFRRDIGVHYLR